VGYLDSITVVSLDRFPTQGGEVLRCLKITDYGWFEFGEAYFSRIDYGTIRGWKLHKKMHLNLIVPAGKVEFVFYGESKTGSEDFRKEVIGEQRYVRISVPPDIWFSFRGLSKPSSLILNIANLEHSPDEVLTLPIGEIGYEWNKNI